MGIESLMERLGTIATSTEKGKTMADCTKCLHLDVCGEDHKENIMLCDDFKDRSKWVEQKHGRWERCGGDLHSSGYAIYCSACCKTHFVHYKHSLGGLSCEELFEKPKFCPSCGAVMEIEE